MVCKGASVLLIFAFVAILAPARLSANPLPWLEEAEVAVAVQNSDQSSWQQEANKQDLGLVLESVGSATNGVEHTDAPAEGQESPSGTPARADEAAVGPSRTFKDLKDLQEIVNGQDSTITAPTSVDHQDGSEQGATDDDMARSYTVGDGYYGEPQQYEQTTNPYYEDQSRPDDYITYDGPHEDPQYAPEYDDQVQYQDNTAYYDRPDHYQEQYPDTYEQEGHYPEEYQQSAYDSTPTYEHDGDEPATGYNPHADPDYDDYQQPGYEGYYPSEDEQESYGYDNDDYQEEQYHVDEVEHPYTPAGYVAGAYENEEEHSSYDSRYDRRDTGLQYNMYDDTYFYGRYLEDEYYG